jgi:hypothetical protein
MAVWFAVPLIALRGVDVGAAMSASFTACLTNMLPFLVWQLAMLGLVAVSCLPLFVVSVLHLGAMLLLVSALPIMLAGIGVASLFFASLYTSYLDVFAPEVRSPHG